MAPSTAAHHLPEAASSVSTKFEEPARAPEAQTSALKLPFDPLRILDAVFRYRWHAIISGSLVAAALGSFVALRLTTHHTAGAQLIKLAP